MVLHVDRGDRLDQRELLRRLTGLQYTRNDMDFARATFRVRGDVIDIFPAESDLEAVRIELFDDEVESLSAFDPLTGEVIRKLPRFTFYPKSHYVTLGRRCSTPSRRSRTSCASGSITCAVRTSWWRRSGSSSARVSIWK